MFKSEKLAVRNGLLVGSDAISRSDCRSRSDQTQTDFDIRDAYSISLFMLSRGGCFIFTIIEEGLHHVAVADQATVKVSCLHILKETR